MNELVIGRTSSGGRSFPLSFRVEYLRRWDECVERGAKGMGAHEGSSDERMTNSPTRSSSAATEPVCGSGSTGIRRH